jgi:putative serine protease PepD
MGTKPLTKFVGAALVAAVSAGVGAAVALTADLHTGPSRPAIAASPVGAQSAANLASGSVEQVAAKVLPSVVELQTTQGPLTELGSGVVLSADGLILTNAHVVSLPTDDPASQGTMQSRVTLADGRSAPLSIVGTDPSNDIAVVRVKGISGLTPINLGSSSNLQVGQKVVAVGSPLGLNGTVTSGIISALNRVVSSDTSFTMPHAIQTDAPLNPGNSGGALVNMNGQLIGINSAIASPGNVSAETGSTGLGFAIPVDQAKAVADKLIAAGTAQAGSVGESVNSGTGSVPVK